MVSCAHVGPRLCFIYRAVLICSEAMRLGYADAQYWIADPSVVDVPVKDLLSKARCVARLSMALCRLLTHRNTFKSGPSCSTRRRQTRSTSTATPCLVAIPCTSPPPTARAMPCQVSRGLWLAWIGGF